VPRFLIVTTEAGHWRSLSGWPERVRHNYCCGFGSLIAGNLKWLVGIQSLATKASRRMLFTLGRHNVTGW